MRILLDENLDWRLARDLLGHEVRISPTTGMGRNPEWSIAKESRRNRLADTIPLMPKILQNLPYIESGTVTAIE